MTSVPAALLLLAVVGVGVWLEHRSRPHRHPRVYFGEMPSLQDCLQPPPPRRRFRLLQGGRHD